MGFLSDLTTRARERLSGALRHLGTSPTQGIPDSIVGHGPPLESAEIEYEVLGLRAVCESDLAALGQKARFFSSAAYQLGLNDGKLGIPKKHAFEVLDQSVAGGRLLTPANLNERLLEQRARLTVLEQQRAKIAEEVDELRQLRAGIHDRIHVLDERETRWTDSAMEYEEKSADLARGRHESHPNRIYSVSGRSRLPLQHPFAALITGFILLFGAAVFVLMDLGMSIEAVYALGIADPKAISWQEAFWSPSLWPANWMGLSVCLGIATITLIFKYAYEQVRFEDFQKKRRPDRVITLSLVTVGFGSLIMLGWVRADYMLAHMRTVNQDVNEIAAFWSLLVPMVAMPAFGAVFLAEGLNKVFRSARALFPDHMIVRWFPKLRRFLLPARVPIGRELGVLHELREDMRKRERDLFDRIDEKESRIDSLTEQREQLSARSAGIEELQSTYLKWWDSVTKRELSLYEHGYETGRRLHAEDGAFAVLNTFVVSKAMISGLNEWDSAPNTPAPTLR